MSKGSTHGKNPSVEWFFNDWSGGTLAMSRFLKGCYMDLLTAQFNIGHLSMDEVRTVLGSDFQAAWPTLQKKFRQNPEGLFFNARLDLQIKKKLAYNKSRNNNLEGDGRDSSRHMGNGYDSGLGSGFGNFGKCENLFFGDVPNDIVELSGRLEPTANAAQWQDYVQNELEKIGYAVEREVPCNSEVGAGRIDLVAKRNGISVAVELDYRTPRHKSIAKVKTYPFGCVLLRDPKIVEQKPIDAKLIHPLQNHIAEKYQRVSKIEMQLTYDECERLCANYDKRLIDEVLQAMDNYKNLTKKYVSVNLTIQNWIKKRISDGESKPTFKANGSDRGAHSDEELIRGVEKRMREKQQSGSV